MPRRKDITSNGEDISKKKGNTTRGSEDNTRASEDCTRSCEHSTSRKNDNMIRKREDMTMRRKEITGKLEHKGRKREERTRKCKDMTRNREDMNMKIEDMTRKREHIMTRKRFAHCGVKTIDKDDEKIDRVDNIEDDDSFLSTEKDISLSKIIKWPKYPDQGVNQHIWTCDKCKDIFPEQKDCLKHAAKKHGFPCDICEITTITKIDLYKHKYHKHQQSLNLTWCMRCQDMIDIKSWASHQRKPHASKCNYQDCEAAFTSSHKLWQHSIRYEIILVLLMLIINQNVCQCFQRIWFVMFECFIGNMDPDIKI